MEVAAPGVLALLLAGTLAGFAFAVWALRALLAPVRLAFSSLKEYLDSGALPELPIGFGDEAGRLMVDVRYAAENMDATVRSLGVGGSGTEGLATPRPHAGAPAHVRPGKCVHGRASEHCPAFRRDVFSVSPRKGKPAVRRGRKATGLYER